jgi:hypothetical protein
MEQILAYDFPILTIDTDYNIREEDLGDNNIMKGVDCSGRAFLCIKATFITEQNAYIPSSYIPSFSTFFQNQTTWHCRGPLMLTDDGGMSSKQIDALKKLIDDKCIDVIEKDIFNCHHLSKVILQNRRFVF